MKHLIVIITCLSCFFAGFASGGAAQEIAPRAASFDEQIGLVLAAVEAGDFRDAFDKARFAYRLARTAQARRQAARLAAGAAYRSGYFTRAEWWLRRAANHSETPEQSAEIAADFRTVRADNPLRTRLNFSVAPSSNINGGAQSRVFFLGDFAFVLPSESLALSGLEVSGDVDLQYRISSGPRHQTSLGVYAYGRTFRLNRGSRRAAPSVSGADYAMTLLEASASHRHLIFDSLGPSMATVRVGRIRFGGRPVWDYARLALTQDVFIGQNLSLSAEAAIEGQKALDGVQPDARVHDLNLRLARRLPNNDVLHLSLESRWNQASIATYAYDDHRLSVGYDFNRAVLGMRLSARVGVGRKSYDTFSLSLNGRRDDYVQASVNAVFEDLSLYGFSPSLTLTATRTDSNVDRFTTRSLQARFGIQSNF